MVFGWDDDEKEVTYLRQPNTRHERNVQLFYYDGHYSAVKNMSTLMRHKMHDNASHYCPYLVKSLNQTICTGVYKLEHPPTID